MSNTDLDELHEKVAAILIQFDKLMTKAEECNEPQEAAIHRPGDKLQDAS